jgi:flavin-dependent dehydrogenase
MDLDNFLLDVVRKNTQTDVFTSTQLDKITTDNEGVTVTIKDSNIVFKGKMIIGADGANSIVAKQLTEKTIDRKHYLGAVRAYYSNVKDVSPTTSEVFFSPKFGLNYLWVFPVEGGKVNVGFGLLSQYISDQKINLKDTFYKYFKESPELGAKFKDAVQEGPLEGFGVPLGPTIGAPSGTRFMLLGDAASLSNPLSGTGMGNAVLSGKLAATQITSCFKNNDFSAGFMQQYDAGLQKAIVNDLVKSYKVQRSLSKMPFILDVVFWLGSYPKIKKYIQSMV